MKVVLFTVLLITYATCQAVAKPSKTDDTKGKYPPVYPDNVQVNLKTMANTNSTIRKSLDKHIAEKKALIVKGNKYNANMKQVTGYVDTWVGDIKKVGVQVKKFEGDATKTRHQWSTVKKTQEPQGSASASVQEPTAPKVHIALKSKKSLGTKAKPAKKLVGASENKKSKQVKRRLQAVQNKKTLESVNAQYTKQVDELEKNIRQVIVQIKAVYALAKVDDDNAVKLQAQQVATLKKLKEFLAHIKEYIGWTKSTMKKYLELFHTRPDNVFETKANRLLNLIQPYLE